MIQTAFPHRSSLRIPAVGSARGTVDALRGSTEPDLARVAAHIARHGLHVMHVGQGCDCPGCGSGPLPPGEMFGYTIGLTGIGHPELLIRGLPARETARVLGTWGEAVLDGDELDAGHLLCEGAGGTTWELVPVRSPARDLPWARRFYRSRYPDHPGVGTVEALELIPARRACPCQACD